MASKHNDIRPSALPDEALVAQVYSYRKVVGQLLKEAFALAVETGSEVFVVSSFKGAASSWASPKFDPLASEEAGRKVVASLLKKQLEQQQIIPPSETTAEEAAADAAWSDALCFLEDVKQRLAAFQQRLTQVLRLAHDLPEQYPGCETCALVASMGGKIFSWASPALQPLIASKAGKGLIMAMLGDPEAQKTLNENLRDLTARQREHFAKVTAAAAEMEGRQDDDTPKYIDGAALQSATTSSTPSSTASTSSPSPSSSTSTSTSTSDSSIPTNSSSIPTSTSTTIESLD